jgi:hypothetical protein
MIGRFDDNSGIVDHYCLDFLSLIPKSRIHFKANRASIK